MLLINKDKNLLLNILKNSIKTNVEVWVFGSRVSGRAHSGSDLDLVILTKNKAAIDADELEQFKQNLRKSNIPFLIDVLDWNRIPAYFKDNIRKQYEVLKEYNL